MATNDVLDRLEALLAAATHGPWDRIRSQDYAYIVALHEAAPALIRLARGAIEMVSCAERSEKGEDFSQEQVDAMGAEIESAAKALGEVRL